MADKPRSTPDRAGDTPDTEHDAIRRPTTATRRQNAREWNPSTTADTTPR